MATSFPVEAKVSGAIKDIKSLEDALRKTGKEAGLTEKQIEDIVTSTKKARTEGGKNFNEVNKSLDGIHSTAKKVGAAILATFAIDKIKDFIGQVVNVTAEFQKLDAVLTNTLGSKSAAQRALKEIRDIAASTPFSVVELTQSYVKLVNQGIKPTREEIIKLGDLASSTGKQFDQLTEAIIDAQTGEFERLKEFGIRASKQGDQVTFTFKGVQTQVAFTSDAIKDYIFKLGELQGVSGSMNAISATLGGQISNLGDAYDSLLNTIGDGNNGVLSGAVDLMKELVEGFEAFFKTQQQVEAEIRNASGAAGIEDFKAYAKAFDDINKAKKQFTDDNEKEIDQLRELNLQAVKKKDFDVDEVNRRVDRIARLIEENKAVEEYVELTAKEAELKKTAEADDAKRKRLEAETEAYKKVLAARQKFLKSFLTENTTDSELGDPGTRNLLGKFLNEDQKKAINADSASTAEQLKGKDDLEFEALVAKNDRELKLQQEYDDKKKQAIGELRDYTIDAFEEVFKSRVINTQRQLGVVDAQYQYELSLAGNNEKAKQDITKRFEAQRVSLLNKQAQQQQEAAIFSILANQGPAVAKTAAELGFPLAIPFVAAVLGLFALTLSNQKKVQAPKFAAEGDFDIKGPGTETSDSIPYMLSVRETVNPARNTKRFGWLLGPMVKKKDFNEYDLRHLVDKNLPTEYNPVFVNQSRGADIPELVEELRATRRAIENKKETHISYDQEGFSIWMVQGNQRTKRANRKYSM